ncbi:MAG TPA: hypothetical protein VJV87_02125, partial [Sphingomicrobium sp.]|nr:hypothetical protein [Sphingomicrobium sp.]
EVKEALKKILGAGNVSVVNEAGNDKVHFVTFEGAYAHSDVEMLTANKGTIEGGGGQKVNIFETAPSWGGHIGEGNLTEATGVAAYTYKAGGSSFTYHLAIADAAEDKVKLFSAKSFTAQKLRRTIDGPAEGEEFGFGAQGAYLGSDPGTCPPAGGKACTAGHFFLYDDANEALEEFEADGELLSQTPFAFGDGAPTAIATDRSGGANNGTLYASTGAGAGARVLAFGALGAPSRPGPLTEKEQSLTLAKACSVAIDSSGNRYVAVGPEILVYPPTGSKPLAKIAEESGTLCRIAVDSEGNVYALLKEKVAYFKPSSFPPKEGTTYGAAVTVAKQSEFGVAINALTIDPASGHLFVTSAKKTIEYDSAFNGSGVLSPSFAGSLSIGARTAIATCAKGGDVYVAAAGKIFVLDKAGKEVLTQTTGTGSPAGSFGASAGAIAVDQSNCHVIVFETKHENIQEYESSGTYLASFGSATPLVTSDYGIAVDNGSSSPNKGDVFLAFDDTTGTFDLSAFGGLGYPPPAPTATTTAASNLAPGKAILNGTVNPNGSPLEACRFEYLTQAEYEANGENFTGAEGVQCAESLEEIGEGSEAVPVHADVEGLSAGTTYFFRLVVKNAEGTGEGEALQFALNPPVAIAKTAQPITFTEATLRGEVDPAGSPTTYFFQYLSEADFKAEGFGGPATQTTPEGELPGTEGFLAVKAQIGGLAEGTEYRFRLVAQNGIGE